MTPHPHAIQATRARLVLAFAAVYLIWGSTYLAIRVAIETLPPLLMAGVRFMTAGAILYCGCDCGANRRHGACMESDSSSAVLAAGW